MQQKRAQSGLIVQQRAPDEKPENENAEDNSALEDCAQELIQAIKSGDHKNVAQILKDMFQICDAQPHEEGEHTNSFDEQNKKAAE